MVLPRSAKRTVDAVCLPITLEEVQQAAGIAATTAHDERINRLMKAAVAKVERDTRRAFVKQTWVHKFDCFPSTDHFELGRPPLMSVSSFTYEATTGTATLTTSTYSVDTHREPGVLFTQFGQSWPTEKDVRSAVVITAVHGYSTSSDGVPEDAKQAMLMLVDDWLCNSGMDGPMNTVNYDSLIVGLRWGDYR